MIQSFDDRLLDFFGSLQVAWLTPIMIFLSNLTAHGELWIAAGLSMLIFKRTRKMGFAVLLALLFDVVLTNLLIKPLVARTRPFDAHEITLLVTRPKDYSFPSGHSAASFAGALAMLLHDKRFGIPAMVLAAVIAFSRLYLQVHYFTDVAVGILIGCLCAIAATAAVRAADKKLAANKLK